MSDRSEVNETRVKQVGGRYGKMDEEREDLEVPRILLIEDEDHIALAIRLCLEGEGYRVETALDGLEGLEKAFSLRPSLILLDLRMPKMSGHLVLETLREDERTKDIPVVVLTALSDVDEKEKALLEGAREYLIKPFTPKDLLTVVKRYLPE